MSQEPQMISWSEVGDYTSWPKSYPKPDSVRIAGKEDKQALYDCLMELWKDNWLGYSMSPRKVWDAVHNCCDHKGAIAGIIEEEGKIVATVGIFFSQDWYSDQSYLRELWLFVCPEVRKGKSYANDLVAFSLWYRSAIKSEETGELIPLVTGVNSRKRLAEKMRWWSRWSRLVGAVYLVEGN